MKVFASKVKGRTNNKRIRVRIVGDYATKQGNLTSKRGEIMWRGEKSVLPRRVAELNGRDSIVTCQRTIDKRRVTIDQFLDPWASQREVVIHYRKPKFLCY